MYGDNINFVFIFNKNFKVIMCLVRSRKDGWMVRWLNGVVDVLREEKGVEVLTEEEI